MGNVERELAHSFFVDSSAEYSWSASRMNTSGRRAMNFRKNGYHPPDCWFVMLAK